MFYNKAHLRVNGNEERIYEFFCDNNSPLGEIHDALMAMKAHVVKLINDQVVKENAQTEEKKEEAHEGI